MDTATCNIRTRNIIPVRFGQDFDELALDYISARDKDTFISSDNYHLKIFCNRSASLLMMKKKMLPILLYKSFRDCSSDAQIQCSSDNY